MPFDNQPDLEKIIVLLHSYQIALSARDKYRERESARDNPLKKSESESRFHLRDVKDINEALDAMPDREPGHTYQNILDINKKFFKEGEGKTSKIGDRKPQVENQAVQNLRELITLAAKEMVEGNPQVLAGKKAVVAIKGGDDNGNSVKEESEFKKLITGIYERIQKRKSNCEKTKQLRELMNDYFPFIEFNEDGTLKAENNELNDFFYIPLLRDHRILDKFREVLAKNTSSFCEFFESKPQSLVELEDFIDRNNIDPSPNGRRPR